MATTLEDSELTSIRERLRVAAAQEGSDRWLAAFLGERGDSERLPLPLEDYIEVLRWSAVAVRGTSRPAQDNVVKCLARLELDSDGFVEVLRNYARSFFTMVGHVHRIDLESRRRGYKRRPGVRGAQRLYRIAAG